LSGFSHSIFLRLFDGYWNDYVSGAVAAVGVVGASQDSALNFGAVFVANETRDFDAELKAAFGIKVLHEQGCIKRWIVRDPERIVVSACYIERAANLGALAFGWHNAIRQIDAGVCVVLFAYGCD
jgi:hypothetical protein